MYCRSRGEEGVQSQYIMACANAVSGRLPRELRDEIYSHMWDEEVTQVIDYTGLIEKPTPKLRSTFPNYIKPACVGAQFAREAVQWAYEHLDLSGGTQDWPDFMDMKHHWMDRDPRGLSLMHIENFLHGDVFRLGISPKDIRMSRLTVRIPKEAWKNTKMLDKHFAPLLKLGNFKRQFRLQINLVPGRGKTFERACREGTFATLLSKIEAVSTQFKKMGVTVILGYSCEWPSQWAEVKGDAKCGALAVYPFSKQMLKATVKRWEKFVPQMNANLHHYMMAKLTSSALDSVTARWTLHRYTGVLDRDDRDWISGAPKPRFLYLLDKTS